MTSDLEARADSAEEAEAEAERYNLEEAVLATIAQAGESADCPELFAALDNIDWQRPGFKAIARALKLCNLEGLRPDAGIIELRLPAGAQVKDEVLSDVLSRSKAIPLQNALEYVKELKRQDWFRETRAALQNYSGELDKAETNRADIDGLLERFRKDVYANAQAKHLTPEHPTAAEQIPAVLAELERRRDLKRRWEGLDWGFEHLNNVFDGLQPGAYILGGPPGCGKTTLAKQIADTVAVTEKVPVLFWAFEQSDMELHKKSLARLAQIDLRKITKGTADEKAGAWEKVKAAAEKYDGDQGPYLTVISATGKETFEHICTHARTVQQKADGPIFLVIDYLQIMCPTSAQDMDVRQRLDFYLSELRRLARDIKSPILIVSSLNRDAYRTKDGKMSPPSMTSAKESGGIEYTADGFIGLWENTEESKKLTEDYKRPTHRIEAHILKNKNGICGSTVKLNFTGAWAMFDDPERKPV